MILSFLTNEGTDRNLSIVDYTVFGSEESPMFGWWREGNKLGFCLPLKHLKARHTHACVVDGTDVRWIFAPEGGRKESKNAVL